jgi:hypothetical protein
MLRKSFLIFAVLSAAILIGCGKTEVNVSNSNSTTKDGDKATTSTPATTTTKTSSGEKIGIAACDDFIDKYEACVNAKVPEAQRAQYQSTLKQWRDSWRELAKNPMTKGTLEAGCKQAAEQAKNSMKAYDCTF